GDGHDLRAAGLQVTAVAERRDATSVTRAIVAASVLLAVAIGLQVVRDRRYPDSTEGLDPFLYLQSGPMVTRLALSYSAVAADLDWIRAVQHFGGDHLSTRPKKYHLLYPLLDRATTLDARVSVVYRFGAISLSGPSRV